MFATFSAALLAYLLYTAIRLFRVPPPRTVAEFFSFGRSATSKNLRDAFFVTNASFATAFVTLFLFVGSQGILSIVTPLSFITGCLFFSLKLVPKAVPYMASGRRYPQLLGDSTQSKSVRIFCSLYVIFSLWLFTYTELHGFLAFARSRAEFSISPALPFIITIPIIVFMGFYTARLGFSGVLASDRLQRRLITAGGLSFIALAVYTISSSKISFSPILLQFPPEGFTIAGSGLFVVETLVGFFFSQLLYYDNWQRIGAFATVRLSEGATLAEVEHEVSASYWQATLWLLLLYSVPIALGATAISMGTPISDIGDLSRLLQSLWDSSLINRVLLFICFVYLSAAVVSTIEVYVISMANNILDDVTGVTSAARARPDDQSLLQLSRVVAFCISLSFLPALFVEPNFELIFVYMFYSANGLVGPLLLLILGRLIRSWGVIVSVAFCATWPALSAFLPGLGASVTVPGLLTVAMSIFISFLASRGAPKGGGSEQN